MRIFLKSLLSFALIFSAAYIARILIVPNVGPIGDDGQSGWQLQLAFLLTSTQNIGLIGMVLVMILALLNKFRILVVR